jgi:hypothetical protein
MTANFATLHMLFVLARCYTTVRQTAKFNVCTESMTLNEFRAAHIQEAERAEEQSSEQSAEPAPPAKKKGLFSFGGKDKSIKQKPVVIDDSNIVSDTGSSSSSTADSKQQLPLYVFQQDSEACAEGYELLKQFGKWQVLQHVTAKPSLLIVQFIL